MIRGLLWRAEARRILREKGFKPVKAGALAAKAWAFAAEALEEWGGPLMEPQEAIDIDLGAYHEGDSLVTTMGERDVLAERRRHVIGERWTAEHDDDHDVGELAWAAAAYALFDAAGEKVRRIWARTSESGCPDCWPWADHWWKPKERRRNLVRAGALILAEIDKIDRARALS